MNDIRYKFDKVINRLNSRSEKWDAVSEIFNKSDLLPLWVADMDFQSPSPIIEALVHRVNHGIFGYSYFPPEYYTAVINWFQRRHNWHIDKNWIHFTPGVIPALNFALQAFSEKWDKIIIQSPAYTPFYMAVRNNHRKIVLNPLKLTNGKYRIDFGDLRKKVKNTKVKILILCSPQNPTGRVWTKEELITLGEICLDHQVLIISDEIHCDIIYPGYKHIPFASLSERFAQNSITCTSPSKTFNIPSLKVSNIIIPNRRLSTKFNQIIQRNGCTEPNCFASIALEAAYNDCEEWLEALIGYLKSNLQYLKKFINEYLPELEVIEPEGTFLVWLDFRKLRLKSKHLNEVLFEKAKVALWEGYLFGKEGKGFERINIACPRTILEEALMRIKNAIKNYKERN
jgi:cystathionine beta-lyase